jgi:hypothetical protein
MSQSPTILRLPACRYARGHALLLAGVLAFALFSDVFALTAGAAERDWTVKVSNRSFGFLGYPSGTFVCYGSGNIWVSLPIEVVAAVTTVVPSFALICFIYWLRNPRRKRAA